MVPKRGTFAFMKNGSASAVWILLVTSFLVITPGAYFHAFHSHEETRCSPSKECRVEVRHQHCKSLQTEARCFTAPDPLSGPVMISRPGAMLAQPTVPLFIQAVIHPNLRAPPIGTGTINLFG